MSVPLFLNEPANSNAYPGDGLWWILRESEWARVYLYLSSESKPSELDGSYIILSNTVPGPPTLADLLDIKIVDHYGPGAVFDVSVSAQGFNITSFGPQGFTGAIAGSAQSY